MVDQTCLICGAQPVERPHEIFGHVVLWVCPDGHGVVGRTTS